MTTVKQNRDLPLNNIEQLKQKPFYRLVSLITLCLYLFLSAVLYHPFFHTCLTYDFILLSQSKKTGPFSRLVENTSSPGISFSINYCVACKWISDSKTDTPSKALKGVSPHLISQKFVKFQQQYITFKDYNFFLRGPPSLS